MSRSLKVDTQYIQQVKQSLKRNGLRNQRALAEELGIALSTISRFLNGKPVDTTIFVEICDRLRLDWQTVAFFEGSVPPSLSEIISQSVGPITHPPIPIPQIHRDWGESVDVTFFHGRSDELKTLKTMLLTDHCHLVSIIGLGGIGKTTVATKLAQDLQDEFDYIIWRSLYNAPPLESILQDLVSFLSQQQDTEATIPRLLHWLRQFRCLIVLDNVETLLQSQAMGQFQPDYANYEYLFQSLGEANHQSTIVMTSREQPAVIAVLEGQDLSVKSLLLEGSMEAAAALIDAKGLQGTESEKAQLSSYYGCNPLAIKIIATSIQAIFDGDVSVFLNQETTVFNGLRRLLAQQFERLAPLELTVLYWLAVTRTWTAITELSHAIYPGVSQANLLEALESLNWRSLIEVRAGQYTLQPMVMEYLTEQFIDEAIDYLSQKLGQEPSKLTNLSNVEHSNLDATTENTLSIFHRLAFLQTTAHDHIRNSQQRLILNPIANRLTTLFPITQQLTSSLNTVLQDLREHPSMAQGYGAGNFLNLYQTIGVDLKGLDFSALIIRQADLSQRPLHHINFNHSTFLNTRFVQSFGNVISVSLSPQQNLLAASDSHNDIHIWSTESEQSLLTLKGHTGWANVLIFNQATTQLVSGSADASIRIWDLGTGTCLQTIQALSGPIYGLALSPDGFTLASTGEDTPIKLWNIQTGECLYNLTGHLAPGRNCAFSASGQWLGTSSLDQTVRIWSLEAEPTCQQVLEHPAPAWSVAFSPDERFIATACLDTTLRLWDRATGKCVQIFKGHQHHVWAVAFSPEGTLLASGGADHSVRLWEIKTGRCLAAFHEHQDQVLSVSFSANGRVVASGGLDQHIKLWDVVTRQCWRSIKGFTNRVKTLTFDDRGQWLISGSDDSNLRLWDVDTRTCLQEFQGHQSGVWYVAFDTVDSLVQSEPPTRLICSCGFEPLLKLWNIATGECLQSINVGEPWMLGVAFDAQAQIAISCNFSPAPKLWNLKTGQLLGALEGHTNMVWRVAFSPDKRQVITASADHTVKLWDLKVQTCLKTYPAHDDLIYGLAVAPSAKATTDPKTGYLFATGGADNLVKIWHSQSQDCLHCLVGHDGWVFTLAFSPNGQLLASGSFDHTVKIWNVATGECLHTLKGHTDEVWAVAFSPNGQVVASGSTDTTIKIWDVQTGDCLKTLTTTKPYQGMNITGVLGLTLEQKLTLTSLGAVEEPASIA